MEYIGTIGKAAQVLETLRQAPSALALADVADTLSMPKATVHRLLSNLMACEWVEADGRGHYRLGSGLLRLGLGVLGQEPVVRAARPHLENGAATLGETFFVVVARAGRLRVLDKVEGTGILRVAPEVGSEVPIESTASGRLYMAHAPELLNIDAKVTKLRAKTAATAKTRKLGFDVSHGEWIDGLGVVAAPVLVRDRLHGCIACALPVQVLDTKKTQQVVSATKAAALATAQALGEQS
jgi:IclR family acetate operon transcriptional repressor